jgi:hypothetical protein
MGATSEDAPGTPSGRIERVRCLGCGAVYIKPAGGGTVSANPGCPECGYVGWVLESSAVKPGSESLRSVADRLRRRTG